MFYLLRLYIPLFDPFITDMEARLKWFDEGEAGDQAFVQHTQRGILAAPLVLAATWRALQGLFGNYHLPPFPLVSISTDKRSEGLRDWQERALVLGGPTLTSIWTQTREGRLLEVGHGDHHDLIVLSGNPLTGQLESGALEVIFRHPASTGDDSALFQTFFHPLAAALTTASLEVPALDLQLTYADAEGIHVTSLGELLDPYDSR
jgi:hypothetical protein